MPISINWLTHISKQRSPPQATDLEVETRPTLAQAIDLEREEESFQESNYSTSDSSEDFGCSGDSNIECDTSFRNDDSTDEGSNHENEDHEAIDLTVAEERPEASKGDVDVEFQLSHLAVRHGLSYEGVRDFAELFRKLGFPIHKDPRTIMNVNVQPLLSSEFYHFGLIDGLRKKLRHWIQGDSDTITLHFNIDGIPLFNNSKLQAWPILCRIINAKEYRPFPVSLWIGEKKPSDLEQYLTPFVDELCVIGSQKFVLKNSVIFIKIGAIICDRVARSLVKFIIYHNARKACERSNVIGKSRYRRTFFLLE